MTDLVKIKRRIRSLLEVAKAGSGATDPERATARRLADRLLAAFKLAEADVPARQVERALPPPPPPPPAQFVQVILRFDSFSGGFGFGTQTTGNW